LEKIKLYIIVFSVVCLGFALGLLVLLNSLTPDRWGNVLLFYFLLCGFIFSLGTVIGFNLRRFFGQRELLNQYFRSSIRQAVWFTILVVAFMFLLSKNLFNWISGLSLVLCLIFLEAYLLTKNK